MLGTRTKESCKQSSHQITFSLKAKVVTYLDYDSIKAPDTGEDDAVEDEGEGERLGGLGGHDVGDGGQGGQAVAH